MLEAKIINQLIHQIDPTKIRKTSFTAQMKDNQIVDLLKSFFIVLDFLIIIYLFFFNEISPVLLNLNFFPIKNFFSFLTKSDGLVFLVIILITSFFYFIFILIRQSRGFNLLRRINVKDIELNFKEENGESFFNKYLTEIRYLFEHCDSTIVAIEDIDRYYSCSIFENIRELNTIINYDRDENPIRFFYIIKDDLFASKERTKFFDFIIPIVPILDSSNSYAQLRDQLLANYDESQLDKRFLRGLSIYIDEMRVLKNIINEFQIYYTELFKQELDPNRLLAIIVYKNLFPKDFNDLQAGKGYLFDLIRSRDKFADYVLKNDREFLEKINNQINAIEKENLENLDELGALYLKPTPGLYIVNNQRVENIVSQSVLFTEISKNPQVQIINLNIAGTIPVDLSQKLNDLEKDEIYKRRKNLIDRKSRNDVEKLKRDRNEIESKINTIL